MRDRWDKVFAEQPEVSWKVVWGRLRGEADAIAAQGASWVRFTGSQADFGKLIADETAKLAKSLPSLTSSRS